MNWKLAVAMKDAMEVYPNVEVYINHDWNECLEVTDGIDDWGCLQSGSIKSGYVHLDYITKTVTGSSNAGITANAGVRFLGIASHLCV